MKRVAIVGGAGRIGQAIALGLGTGHDVEVVALIDVHEPPDLHGARYASTLEGLDPLDIDVVVDFSVPDGVVASAEWCAKHRVALVVGTTGLSAEQRRAVVEASSSVGIVIASNFSIGAVLAERFAAQAAPYFERVEIIELHHDRKVDAPSGTSIAAARAIAASRAACGKEPLIDPTQLVSLDGARGANAEGGVRIHSVRLPGLVAHQEVLFGGPGEGLTIRHDSYDRQSFVQGVLVAVQTIDSAPRLIDGIASLVT